MCGFVGAAGATGTTEPVLVAMRDTLRRRGPDGLGLHLASNGDGPAGLGFCRLAIIDLSEAGNQPLPNKDGTVWAVVNGEIYNFAELRAGLVAGGHRFRSQTDAEVVVHLYE